MYSRASPGTIFVASHRRHRPCIGQFHRTSPADSVLLSKFISSSWLCQAGIVCLSEGPLHKPKIMARSMAAILRKGITAFPTARPAAMVSPCFSRTVGRYSTTVPHDPDTHEDFRPANKLPSSGLSLENIVEQDVKENPVMIYMKGVPDLPRCGFSSLAVRVLNEYSVPISARNILEDPELKNAVKTFSHWPTFPQIFIKGEFVGGSDIILNMHQSGELKEKLKDIAAANQEKAE